VDQKEAPIYHMHKLEFDYFDQSDINWFGKPKSDNIKNFVNKDFDILLDMTQGEYLPLNYVLKQSRAKFKVGPFSEEREYDFDLNIESKRNQGLEEFIKQVNYFLNRINHRA
ncbi:MAG: hypothetical protein AAF487_12205, partial [Bacteroidota bacterium]